MKVTPCTPGVRSAPAATSFPLVPKIVPLAEAVAGLVRDGDTVALEGFTHLIPFAAGHEIIRQRRRDLTLVRMTPDVIYDQLIGAGCARQAGLLLGRQPRRRLAAPHARRAGQRLARRRSRSRSTATRAWPTATSPARPGCRSRCCAGTRAPTCPSTRPRSRAVTCPFTGEQLAAVQALNPDVGVVHAQRADRRGNVQLWGIVGVQKEVVLASRRALVTVEEIVDELTPVPGAVVLPHWVVDAIARGPRRRRARPTRRTTTTATTTPTAPGTRSAATASAFRHWLGDLRWPRDHPRRDDERRRRPGPARRPGVLRRDRPAVHGGQPRPPPARADLVLIYESGTLDARPEQLPLSIGDGVLADVRAHRHQRPEVFNYWLQPGRIDVGFLSGAQIDRFGNINTTVIGEYDEPLGAAPRLRRRAGDRGVLPRGDRRDAAPGAGVRRPGRLRHLRRLRHGPGDRARARPPRPRTHPGDHRPRRARARPRDQGAGAHRACTRASRSRRCGRRPAGSCRCRST